MRQAYPLFSFFALWAFYTAAQDKIIHLDQSKYKTVVIDGVMDSAEWAHIQPLDPLINKWPVDSGLALQQSSIRLAFDDQFLYVSAINYQEKTNTVIQKVTLAVMVLRLFWILKACRHPDSFLESMLEVPKWKLP
jgi:hypothetical protein